MDSDFRKRGEVFKAIVDAFGDALHRLKQSSSRKFFVEKTPSHTWYVSDIKQDFPYAKFLFVCRDPRDNFVSYKKKHSERISSYSFASSWLSAFDEASRLSGEECLFVKYENLVHDPDSVAGQICDFLKLRPCNTMLYPSKIGKGWHDNLMFGERKHGINSSSIGRHSDYERQSDIRNIENLTRLIAGERGYHFEDVLKTDKRTETTSQVIGLNPIFGRRSKNWRFYLRVLKALVIGS